jgi:signal transduction histidine kinase
MCSVDPDLLGRCVIHLLTNARESSRNGVHITLGTSREGKDAIIDVIDSGKGMSTKEMNHVFDPFYTTKGDGAGMGLTFVHFVISEHSGQIDLRSMEGVGTRFRIRLPLIEEGSY